MSKIIVTIPFTQSQKDRIAAAAENNEIRFMKAAEVDEQVLEGVDVLIGNIPPKTVKLAKELKWLQLNSAGANNYCESDVLGEDVQLTCASGAYDITVSETLMAYTFSLFKRLPEYHENQKKHYWFDEGPATSAYGAKVLILGLGNIGLAYARRMKAMGSYIIGIKKHLGEIPEGVDEIHAMEDLNQCLAEADVVVNILPGTSETNRILGAEQFAKMKSTAFVINAGRGNAIDQHALCEALKNRQIAGAALDVTDPEPLPEDHELWDAPNLILTPHIAGKFHIPITLEIIADICAENLRHYLKGEKLIRIVNRKAGY